jgi:hypothetical protein
VTSSTVHSSGTVVATCSGQRSSSALVDYENDDSSGSESSSESSDSSSNSDSESSEDESESERERETSPPSPRPVSRIPDNSIKIWKL